MNSVKNISIHLSASGKKAFSLQCHPCLATQQLITYPRPLCLVCRFLHPKSPFKKKSIKQLLFEKAILFLATSFFKKIFVYQIYTKKEIFILNSLRKAEACFWITCYYYFFLGKLMHTTYTPTNTTKAILRFFVAQPCRMFVVRFSQKKVIDAGHTVSCGKADWIHCSRLFQAFPEVRVQSSELCVTSVLPQQLVRTGIIQLMWIPLKNKNCFDLCIAVSRVLQYKGAARRKWPASLLSICCRCCNRWCLSTVPTMSLLSRIKFRKAGFSQES